MPTGSRETRRVVVINPNGLHMRPAKLIAECSRQFESAIEIAKAGLRADGRDVLSILTLFATEGTELEVIASGPDACAAIEAISCLIASDFSEEKPAI